MEVAPLTYKVTIVFLLCFNYSLSLSETFIAQLDRTTQHIDPYWTMPSTNYSKIYTLPDKALLGLLFIGTTLPTSNHRIIIIIIIIIRHYHISSK